MGEVEDEAGVFGAGAGVVTHAGGSDEDGDAAGPREIGDIVICPEHTDDLREAVIHGTLHLTGMDHESDDGEMLALQDELMRWVQ